MLPANRTSVGAGSKTGRVMFCFLCDQVLVVKLGYVDGFSIHREQKELISQVSSASKFILKQMK
jgi:hypothetical protein